jgi:hypothetical protein
MKKRILPFIILFIAAFALSSCILNVVEPGGEYISKEYHVRSFENISVSAGMELLLTQDSAISVRVETYESLIDHINVKVANNTLFLTKDVDILFKNTRIKVFVNAAYLDKIEVLSGSKLNITSGWVTNELEIDMSSGSSGTGSLALNELNLKLNSGSYAKFFGAANELSIEASGGSSFRGLGLNVLNGRADLSSGSYAEINASETLFAKGTDGSIIRYKGNPELIINTSSGASVIKLP